jgi:hypothetical protein
MRVGASDACFYRGAGPDGGRPTYQLAGRRIRTLEGSARSRVYVLTAFDFLTARRD